MKVLKRLYVHLTHSGKMVIEKGKCHEVRLRYLAQGPKWRNQVKKPEPNLSSEMRKVLKIRTDITSSGRGELKGEFHTQTTSSDQMLFQTNESDIKFFVIEK